MSYKIKSSQGKYVGYLKHLLNVVAPKRAGVSFTNKKRHVGFESNIPCFLRSR